MDEIIEEKIIEPKLGDVFKYSDYMPYLEFAQANGYQIIDYGIEDEEKLFKVQEMPVVEPTKEQIAQKQIQRLKQQLSYSDYVVLKIAEGSATAEEYADVLAARRRWRAEINELESPAVEPVKDNNSTVVELSETSEDVVELYSMEI